MTVPGLKNCLHPNGGIEWYRSVNGANIKRSEWGSIGDLTILDFQISNTMK